MTNHRIHIYLNLLLALFLCLPTAAEKTKDRRGRIVLAGVIHAPYGQNDGGAKIAEGIGAVPGVKVEIVGTEYSTTTDKNGLFFFTKAPKGEVKIQMTKPGFQTVSETADVDPDTLDPTTLSVQMLPGDMSSDGKHLTGKGVLYIAFSEDQKELTGHSDSELPIYELLKRLSIENDLLDFQWPQNLDLKRPENPWTMSPNHLMVYPPSTPSRTTFHDTKSEQPYYLTFDSSGDHLYVVDNTPFISIHDINNRNKKLSTVPIPDKGKATSLSTTPNGKYILATVMGGRPGILVIDAATQLPSAYLDLDLPGGSIPTSATPISNGQLLVTAGAPGQPGQLLIVDTYTGATVSAVEVGQKPLSCSVTPDGRFAFVSNSSSGNVTVVDLAQMSAVGTIAVGVSPWDTALTPDGKKLLVSNQGGDTVSVVDVTSREVVKVIEVGKAPMMIAITPDGQSAYVTNRDSHTISTIDLTKLEQTHTTDPMPRSKPTGIAIRP